MKNLLEIGGKRAPFLRWSAVRMMLGIRHLTTAWQVGDGREEALARHVVERATPGDLSAAIDVIDDFCYRRSVMMNVGDGKRRHLGSGRPTRAAAHASRAGNVLRLQRAPDGAYDAGRRCPLVGRIQS